MDSRTYYYARVSTKDQNLDRQISVFKALGATEREIITDKESGKNLVRSGYQALKNTILRRGDTLVIKSFFSSFDTKGDLNIFEKSLFSLTISTTAFNSPYNLSVESVSSPT